MTSHPSLDAPARAPRSQDRRTSAYDEIVDGLVSAIAFDLRPGVPPGAAVGAGDYLRDTNARLPDYLRPVIRLLTIAFDLSALPRHGKVFRRLSLERRLDHIRAWETSRLKPRRSLMTYYRTLATFGLYDERDAAPAEPAVHGP